MYHSVAVMRVRRAVRNGAKLLILSSKSELEENLLDDIATMQINMDDNLATMEQIIGILLDQGRGAGLEGLDELRASLDPAGKIGEEARSAADMITGAGKAVFIFDRNVVTAQSARLIANIAVLSGHAGTPGGSDNTDDHGSGVIQLLNGANSQGLLNLGVGTGYDFVSKVSKGQIRGLLNFGEEVGGIDLRDIEFFAVQEGHMTEAARQSNVVFPGSSFAEKDGSFISSVNSTGELKPAVTSPAAWDNIKLIKELAANAGEPLVYKSTADIRTAMSRALEPDTVGIRLAAVKEGALLRSYNPATNALRIRLMRFAAKHGLK